MKAKYMHPVILNKCGYLQRDKDKKSTFKTAQQPNQVEFCSNSSKTVYFHKVFLNNYTTL